MCARAFTAAKTSIRNLVEIVTFFRYDRYIDEGGENLERELLERLYRQYYRELYTYVFSLCGRQALTEDILQDTFLKALTSLKDSHTNMRAWLYMVARNLYYDIYRKEKRLASAPAGEDGILGYKGENEREPGREAAADVLEEILRSEKRRELRQALEQLTSLKREVLILQYFGSFKHREIAAMLHLTPEHVRLLSYRAKNELRALLKDSGCQERL